MQDYDLLYIIQEKPDQEVHAAVRKWLAEKAGHTVAAETR